MSSDEIAAFVAARLDGDEEAAQDLARGYPGPWSADSSWVHDAGGQVVVHDEYRWSALPHVARHDPARALREVEAGRRLLALAWDADETDRILDEEIAREAKPGEVTTGEEIRRAMAAVWSDHPDYRQEWKP